MLDSIQSLLDAFPEGVVQAHAGCVLAANEKARQYLPQLEPGGPLPAEIPLPPPGETGRAATAGPGGGFLHPRQGQTHLPRHRLFLR